MIAFNWKLSATFHLLTNTEGLGLQLKKPAQGEPAQIQRI
jgi:hypothetical protein